MELSAWHISTKGNIWYCFVGAGKKVYIAILNGYDKNYNLNWEIVDAPPQ